MAHETYWMDADGYPKFGRIIRVGLGAVFMVILGVYSLLGSWFYIDQNELGFVRRWGVVQQPHDQPLGPGLHFKNPFIDMADKIQVSLQTIHIPEFSVLTVDNQRVAIEENFNFTIGAKDVYHVLYEVGDAGSQHVSNQVIPVAHDRTARIFASQNMVTVNANREKIQEEVEAAIQGSVEQLFGIQAHSLQITAIKPSDAFMRSIDEATMAKNAAIAAENQLRTKQFEAQQAAATAKGQADAAIENARGNAASVTLQAEAEKKRLELEGEGLKANLAEQISPFGSAEKYTEYLRAKAQLNWDGRQPQIVTGAGSNTSTPLVIPLDMRK